MYSYNVNDLIKILRANQTFYFILIRNCIYIEYVCFRAIYTYDISIWLIN